MMPIIHLSLVMLALNGYINKPFECQLIIQMTASAAIVKIQVRISLDAYISRIMV